MGTRRPIFERRQIARIESFVPAIERRTRDVEMPTRLPHGMRFSIIEPPQPLPGPFAEPRRVGQLPHAPRQGGGEIDAAATASLFERTPGRSGRLDHAGTSW